MRGVGGIEMECPMGGGRRGGGGWRGVGGVEGGGKKTGKREQIRKEGWGGSGGGRGVRPVTSSAARRVWSWQGMQLRVTLLVGAAKLPLPVLFIHT